MEETLNDDKLTKYIKRFTEIRKILTFHGSKAQLVNEHFITRLTGC